MKRTDTNIHYSELLITLDYLLHKTDEDHPATQTAICDYASKYYGDLFEKSGFRRQRIAKCLEFLWDFSESHPDAFPFVLQKTHLRGKYYIEQRGSLDEKQVAQILAAIDNEKGITKEDAKYFKECISEVLISSKQVSEVNRLAQDLNRSVVKDESSVLDKLRLVNQAFREKKQIGIDYDVFKSSADAQSYRSNRLWYRVYKLGEYKGEPHVVLLPIEDSNAVVKKGILFDRIANLNIALDEKEGILTDDPNPSRNLDALFKEMVGFQSRHAYLDCMKKSHAIVSADWCEVYFYFPVSSIRSVKNSFRQHFSTILDVTKCVSFERKPYSDGKLSGSKLIPNDMERWEKPSYGVSHFFVSETAFLSWLRSDLYEDRDTPVASVVKVTFPSEVNEKLLAYYSDQFLRTLQSMPIEEIQGIADSMKEELEKAYSNRLHRGL